MNNSDHKKSTLLKLLLNDNSASLHAIDTSSVEFDKRYYRQRHRQIRLYKHNLLTDYSEKLFCGIIRFLILLMVFFSMLLFPIVPILSAISIFVYSEEQRHMRPHKSN